LLSLAYNRGVFNTGLESLENVIQDRNWRVVAEIIRRMQQHHKLLGIRIRRRQEAALVSAELDFMGLG
jgi:GH24 family phage-related lysozyme (muramidase)